MQRILYRFSIWKQYILIWDLTSGTDSGQQIIHLSPLFNESTMEHTLMQLTLNISLRPWR